MLHSPAFSDYHGLDRLILKAALANIDRAELLVLSQERTHRFIKLEAKLDAYAEVAADVLGCGCAPQGFRLAVHETLRAMEFRRPLQSPTAGAVRAQSERAAWIEEVLTGVRHRLGHR